jgi:hypothetical protein
MRIADCGLRIADCGLRIADCRIGRRHILTGLLRFASLRTAFGRLFAFGYLRFASVPLVG